MAHLRSEIEDEDGVVCVVNFGDCCHLDCWLLAISMAARRKVKFDLTTQPPCFRESKKVTREIKRNTMRRMRLHNKSFIYKYFSALFLHVQYSKIHDSHPTVLRQLPGMIRPGTEHQHLAMRNTQFCADSIDELDRIGVSRPVYGKKGNIKTNRRLKRTTDEIEIDRDVRERFVENLDIGFQLSWNLVDGFVRVYHDDPSGRFVMFDVK